MKTFQKGGEQYGFIEAEVKQPLTTNDQHWADEWTIFTLCVLEVPLFYGARLSDTLRSKHIIRNNTAASD